MTIINGFQFFLQINMWKVWRTFVWRPPESILCRTAFLCNYSCKSFFGDVSNSFAHLESDIFAHSSLQNSSSSVRLDGERLWTAIFKSCHRFSIGFRSRHWLGHSNTQICFDLNYSIVALAVCLGLLSCLLEGEPPPQSQVSCRLKKVFF